MLAGSMENEEWQNGLHSTVRACMKSCWMFHNLNRGSSSCHEHLKMLNSRVFENFLLQVRSQILYQIATYHSSNSHIRLTITDGYNTGSRSFQSGNNDHWCAAPAEFTRNWESSSASAYECMVSVTGYWNAYKLDIPIQLPMAMMMTSKRKPPSMLPS